MLQVNSDEEVGSASSRTLTEEAREESDAVLVLEPSRAWTGKLKTARKGVGDYTVTVRGCRRTLGWISPKAPTPLSKWLGKIERIAGFTRLDRGITVSPGIIRGGTRSNVVPDGMQRGG